MNVNEVAVEHVWPLAPLQSAMLIASLRTPGAGTFVQQEVIPLQEPIDRSAFETVWRELVRRTPALRASFHWQDLEQPLQVVHQEATLVIEQLNWLMVEPADFDSKLAKYLEENRRIGFPLDQAPLMRLALIRSRAGWTQFVWQFHHILFDGWSAQLLMAEVAEHYGALQRREMFQPPNRPPLNHYIDWLAARDVDAARNYWRGVLHGYDDPIEIGLPRLKMQAFLACAHGEVESCIDRHDSEKIRSFARRNGLTLNTVFQGAWAILLESYTDRRDVVFGTVVSGRSPEVSGIEEMIGLFINAVPVRVEVNESSALVPWLRDLQSAQARGSTFHYLNSAELRRCSELPPAVPLFETLLVFENFPGSAAKSGRSTSGLDLARADLPLSLLVIPNENLLIKVRFDHNRFRPEDMTVLVEHMQNLLRAMPDNQFNKLSALSPLSATERQRLIHVCNVDANGIQTSVDPIGLLAQLARERGNATAFIVGEQRLDYQTLHNASSRLACKLREAGVRAGVTVAVSAPRCFEQIIAFYAILKAHGVYLPLDPAYPKVRIQQMLDDSRPGVVLALGVLPVETPTGIMDLNDVVDPSGLTEASESEPWQPGDPAYIVFTSGSTGRPKGVKVHWGQVANRLAWMWNVYPFAGNEMACQRTPTNFVDSLWELMGAALQGVPTLIVPEKIAVDPNSLISYIAAHRVTRLWLVPSLLKMLLEAQPVLGKHLPHLRFWVSSGEALSSDLYNQFCGAHPDATLYNLYGTSEVWDATWFDPRHEPAVQDQVPIGRPITGMSAYVLDSKLRLVPFEVCGELCIGGTGVSGGYLNAPELSPQRFVSDPYSKVPGARLYRTGDLARIQRNGLIVCLGRSDQQFKLRGIRIEPAEIEMALRRFPGIRDAAVLIRDGCLVAYTVTSAMGFDEIELRRALREQLPDAFVPHSIVRLDALPLMPNGKLDKFALPSPDRTFAHSDTQQASSLEAEVQACFSAVLEIQNVPLDADFFQDLGGHSLLALRVSSRLSRQFGFEVSTSTVFDYATVRDLAAWIAERHGGLLDHSDEELLSMLSALPASEREGLLAELEPGAKDVEP